ncbi:hypothetical protein OH76DRAFT_757700 [Lentinus brumalis]|uniref:Uncharacterized protein n=1 Tax=Lentinus brumalis TaxID=2498619 RepID=A0A371DT10_9APHY|nr:hypothetical protein OH76DRAFT_757700 [Polyporus brumalis]
MDSNVALKSDDGLPKHSEKSVATRVLEQESANPPTEPATSPTGQGVVETTELMPEAMHKSVDDAETVIPVDDPPQGSEKSRAARLTDYMSTERSTPPTNTEPPTPPTEVVTAPSEPSTSPSGPRITPELREIWLRELGDPDPPSLAGLLLLNDKLYRRLGQLFKSWHNCDPDDASGRQTLDSEIKTVKRAYDLIKKYGSEAHRARKGG